MERFKKVVAWVKARYKAAAAALGSLLSLLYVIAAANPNKYVLAAIAVLTVLGVHQAKNQ